MNCILLSIGRRVFYNLKDLALDLLPVLTFGGSTDHLKRYTTIYNEIVRIKDLPHTKARIVGHVVCLTSSAKLGKLPTS